MIQVGPCHLSNASFVNVSSNKLENGEANGGGSPSHCLVNIANIVLRDLCVFTFERNSMSGGSPQLQFGDVDATDACKLLVRRNDMTCGGEAKFVGEVGGGNGCTKPFFWFSSLVRMSGHVLLSVSENTCGGLDGSVQPLLVLVSSVITPCVKCTLDFCYNSMFGRLLETSDQLMGLISAVMVPLLSVMMSDLGQCTVGASGETFAPSNGASARGMQVVVIALVTLLLALI